MGRFARHFKPAVAAVLLALAAGAAQADEMRPDEIPADETQADESRLDALFAQLKQAEDAQAAFRIESAINDAMMRTGSPALDLLLQRGADALSRGDAAAAVEHLTALLDHSPDIAQALNLRAVGYYRSGAIGPALDDLGHALRIEPRHFRAMQGLAVLLEEMGDADGALVLWRAALAIAPMDADIGAAVARLARLSDGTPL